MARLDGFRDSVTVINMPTKMTAGVTQYTKNPDSEQNLKNLVVVCPDSKSVESVSDFVLQ